jgi:hypothetical protein
MSICPSRPTLTGCATDRFDAHHLPLSSACLTLQISNKEFLKTKNVKDFFKKNFHPDTLHRLPCWFSVF